MPPKKSTASAKVVSPPKSTASSGPPSVKPTRSTRKKTLSPKAAAGVEDGIKPAHLTTIPRSRPLPSDVKATEHRRVLNPSGVAEDVLDYDSGSDHVSSPSKLGGAGKRKTVVLSDSSEHTSAAASLPSPKKKKTASARSPQSKRMWRVRGGIRPPTTHRRKSKSSTTPSPVKNRPASDELDSEADEPAVPMEDDPVAVHSDLESLDYDMIQFDPNEPTLSDEDFIDDGLLDDKDGSVDSEADTDNQSGPEIAEEVEDDDEAEEVEDAAYLDEAGEAEDADYHEVDGVDDAVVDGDSGSDAFEIDSEGEALPPSSAPPSPEKKRIRRVVLETDSEGEDSDVQVMDSPTPSRRKASTGSLALPSTPKRSRVATKASVDVPKTPVKVPRTPVKTPKTPVNAPKSTGKGGDKVSLQTPARTSASKAKVNEATNPYTVKFTSESVRKDLASPSKSVKGKEKVELSIKDQGTVSPHKRNTSTGTCQVTHKDNISEFLNDTYRALYPLKRVSIASAAGVNILLTPFAWLEDGTWGKKPINTRRVHLSFCGPPVSLSLISYILLSLLKDVVTFAECGGLKFINPARFPPTRLAPARASSAKSMTFNLSTKELPMGPVSCITFGTVVDSHLFHPRIPKEAGTHSITICPFQGEWERTLACLGNAMEESTFSHYVHLGGVSFQGQWSKPSDAEKETFEAEQAGARLPLYIPPKDPPVVSSGDPSSSNTPGQFVSSTRGLIGQGAPSIGYGTAIPVFDCTRFFQPRRPGEFSKMKSLSDFFSQAGAELCPQIVGQELRNRSLVGVCYSANKWRTESDPPARPFNLGLNVRGVYLLVNGPKA